MYSEQFDNAAWTVSAAAVTANASAAPNATTTADKLTETATTAGHFIAPTANLSFTTATVYTLSVFAKLVERSVIQLVLPSAAFGANVVAVFNLSTGATTVAGGTSPSSTMVAVGNGWYRCSVTATSTATTTAQVQIRLSDSYITTLASYLGVVNSGAYIWGAQVNTGTLVKYIQTTSATVSEYADDARIYQSLEASNTGNTPSTSPTKWQDFGPTIRNAMFDSQVNTMTTGTSPLVVSVQPLQFFDSVAFVGLSGTSINITVRDGPSGAIIFNETKSLDGTVIVDWYQYFFSDFDTLDIAVFQNIPVYLNSFITVTITGANTVGIGAMLYGTTYDIGLTQYGASFSINDYSVKETDDFGNTKFVRRAFSKRVEVELWMENTSIRFNNKLLADLRATPCLWIGVDDTTYEPITVYGFYKDFSTTIDYPQVSMCNIQIEGLI